MDSSEFKKLLEKNESEILDFKRDQYKLDDEPSKSKFIKDVLAMANVPSKGNKHIILGVKAYPDGSKDLAGVKESRDDAQFQSIIRDKVYDVPNFLYEPVEHNHKPYGVITIYESKKRPHMPKRDFGILKEGQVYIRRGTKNDVATKDEIKKLFRIRDLEDVLENISEKKRRKIAHVFVPPQQYGTSVKIVEEKRLIIIVGPPGIGKTALGLHLLVQLKKQARITDFYGFSEYQKLEKLESLGLEDYGIFLDDPFGKSEFTERKIGDNFNNIVDLSKSNFIVITSRSDIFEKAQEFTRMRGLSEKFLKRFIFRLDEHKNYTKENLIQVLRRHLDYSFEIEKGITKGECVFARLHREVIVSSLGSPHNIERLVSMHLKDVKNESSLREAIEEAKGIQNVAGRWFAHLDSKQEKCFVLAVTLFNGTFEEENFSRILNNLFSIFKIKEIPRLADLKRATKHYITTDEKVGFIHQDYYEGVIQEIRKNDYGPYKEDLLLLYHFFKNLVGDEDPYIRFAVTRPLCELAHIDTSKALALVLRLIDDIDPFVQECAIFPLKEITKIDYSKVKDLIENLSISGGVVAKQQIAFLFKEIGPQRPGDALPILEKLVRERTSLVWRAAAYAVGTIGNDHPEMVLPIIKQLAEERFPPLRQAAALIARDVGKVNFEELKPIFKRLIADRRTVRKAASKSIREIGHDRPGKVLDFADELSKDTNPTSRRMAVSILDDLGFINKKRAISILDLLTRDESPNVKALATETLKKLRLGEDFYPYVKLLTSIPSIVDMDKEEVTPHFYELKEKSLAKDFNRALCQAIILPRITEGDVEGLEKFLRIISSQISRSIVLRNILAIIYKFSTEDSEKAISFLVKWHEIYKGSVNTCLYTGMHSNSRDLYRFVARCWSKIYEKNSPDELFDRIERWMKSERMVSKTTRKIRARYIVLTLRELSIVYLNEVIALLQGWLKTENHYILNISTSTLVEIAQFQPDRVIPVFRRLLDEDNETTRKMIFYVFSKIGQKEPEKILPILKDLASHDLLIVRQNISTVLGEIGKYHLKKVLNSLREWAEDEELLNLRTVPHALQMIVRNNRSRQVLIALEQWRDPTNELVAQTIEATYEKLEKEIPKEEIEKRVRKIREKISKQAEKRREEEVEIAIVKELPLLSYLSKREKERILEKYVIILVQHLLSDFIRFLPSLERIGTSPENTVILGIPYSTKSHVISHLRAKGYTVFAPEDYPFIEDIHKAIKESIKRAKKMNREILIVEDGGYIVSLIHKDYLKELDLFRGAVEQTANGIWQDRELEQKGILRIPVMNVAECPLKQLVESPLVGEAIVRNLSNLFAKLGKGIRGKDILIIGYGNVGKQVADILKENKTVTHVYDFDKTKLLQAKNDGHLVKEILTEAVRAKFAIIGGTGRTVIHRDVILSLDHNTYLINATSKRVEINIDELNALTDGVPRTEGGVAQRHSLISGKDVILMAEGFPINFYGDAESIPDENIQFVIGLLFTGILELAKDEFKPGIYDIPEKTRQEIADLQLKLQI